MAVARKRSQTKSRPGFLDGQMIIAMPSMSDERFARTLIYICAHSSDGAMGIVVNQPAPHIKFPDLLVQLDVIPAAGTGTYISGALIEARMIESAPVVRLEVDDAFVHLPADRREAHIAAWLEREIAPLLARLVPTWPSYFGEDFGRDGDLTVIWPLQVAPDLVRVTPFVACGAALIWTSSVIVRRS